MPTAISRLSKPDTLYLAEPDGAGAAALATDLSEARINITNGTTYAYENSSARTAVDAPRAIEVVVDATASDSGILVQHGNAGGYGYRMRINATSQVEIAEGGVLLARASLPSVGAVAQRYAIGWSTFEIPGGVRSELTVICIDTAEVEFAFAEHVASSTSASDTLTVAAGIGGSSAYSGGVAAFHKVRISARHHSQVEVHEDLVAQRTPPTVTEARRAPPLVLDRSSLLVADDGAFIGPAQLMAGASFRDSERRLIGSLVNMRSASPMLISNIYSAPWWRLAPGETTYRMCISYLWCSPVPPTCNRARVRIFVRQGCTGYAESVPFKWRAYSISGLPLANANDEPPMQALAYRTATVSLEAQHVVGDGEWVDLGALKLARDAFGLTFIALAVNIDDDAPSEQADLSYAYVSAFVADPYFEGEEQGLPLINP